MTVSTSVQSELLLIYVFAQSIAQLRSNLGIRLFFSKPVFPPVVTITEFLARLIAELRRHAIIEEAAVLNETSSFDAVPKAILDSLTGESEFACLAGLKRRVDLIDPVMVNFVVLVLPRARKIDLVIVIIVEDEVKFRNGPVEFVDQGISATHCGFASHRKQIDLITGGSDPGQHHLFVFLVSLLVLGTIALLIFRPVKSIQDCRVVVNPSGARDACAKTQQCHWT